MKKRVQGEQMKNLLDAISILLKNIESFIRHILPGFIAIILYRVIVEKKGFSSIASEFTLNQFIFSAFLGIVIYAIHKIIWNLVNSIFDGEPDFTKNLLKDLLLKEQGVLNSILYQYALLHLVLMSAELTLFITIFFSPQPCCSPWMAIGTFLAIIGIFYYIVLFRVSRTLNSQNTAEIPKLVTDIDQKTSDKERR